MLPPDFLLNLHFYLLLSLFIFSIRGKTSYEITTESCWQKTLLLATSQKLKGWLLTILSEWMGKLHTCVFLSLGWNILSIRTKAMTLTLGGRNIRIFRTLRLGIAIASKTTDLYGCFSLLSGIRLAPSQSHSRKACVNVGIFLAFPFKSLFAYNTWFFVQTFHVTFTGTSKAVHGLLWNFMLTIRTNASAWKTLSRWKKGLVIYVMLLLRLDFKRGAMS